MALGVSESALDQSTRGAHQGRQGRVQVQGLGDRGQGPFSVTVCYPHTLLWDKARLRSCERRCQCGVRARLHAIAPDLHKPSDDDLPLP